MTSVTRLAHTDNPTPTKATRYFDAYGVGTSTNEVARRLDALIPYLLESSYILALQFWCIFINKLQG